MEIPGTKGDTTRSLFSFSIPKPILISLSGSFIGAQTNFSSGLVFVISTSNIDGNPYNRFLSHPEERMVCCKADSAVVINQNVFHGNYPNHSNRVRRMLAIAYRPAWAGPIEDVEDWDPEKVKQFPAHIRLFFRSLNTQNIDFDVPNRPDGMQREAPGIAPSRWTLEL